MSSHFRISVYLVGWHPAMCKACARCYRRLGARCRCLFSHPVPPALKVTEVQKRIVRKRINVVVRILPLKECSRSFQARPQALPNEMLRDVLSCVDRRTLDNLCLIRRFSPLLAHCQQLRWVYFAYLSYSPSTYLYSVGFAIKVTSKQHLHSGSPRETWITKVRETLVIKTVQGFSRMYSMRQALFRSTWLILSGLTQRASGGLLTCLFAPYYTRASSGQYAWRTWS